MSNLIQLNSTQLYGEAGDHINEMPMTMNNHELVQNLEIFNYRGTKNTNGWNTAKY